MTIEKGQTWGEPASPSLTPRHAADDAELARLALDEYRQDGHAVLSVGRGDLLNTLGVSEQRSVGERHAYPIDLAVATVDPEETDDGRVIPFVAHLVVEDRPWPGERLIGPLLGHGPAITVAVMNAAWFHDLRLGPRAHPNDGRLDVVEGRVGFRERREANRRAKSGSHLPHPSLRTSRTATWQSKFDHPRPLSVDGVDCGLVRSIRVELIPDALTVVA
jgi:hypothetical protein